MVLGDQSTFVDDIYENTTEEEDAEIKTWSKDGIQFVVYDD